MNEPRSSIVGVQTPAFLVDGAIVASNCERMHRKARDSGVGFRPHVKTHKTVEIARLQLGGTSGPITVSTLAEAEFFADAGFMDITYAVPIAPDKLDRAAALSRRLDRLNLLLDHPETLHAVERYHAAHGVRFDIFLKVDCGYHRAGVDPARAESIELARAMADSPALRFQGLLTHAGHSYDAENLSEVRQIAFEETASLARFRNLLGNGFESLIRSVGSTPTAAVSERFEGCDEVRPGNYVFFDAFQQALGTCTLDEVAASVLTTVIGVYPEQRKLLVDAGALALSKDLGARPDGTPRYGVVCDLARNPLPLEIRSISQEHGQLFATGEFAVASVSVGTKLRVVPNHSCLTAALYDRYHVLENGRVAGEWRPVRGW